jgi:phytoene dehydrogenase-like protein
MSDPDVTVVGSGPNGLAAAVTMARAGLAVRVFELAPTIGGGARTTKLMQSGYYYDRCSAIHPMALASPFFKQFELAERVEFVVPEISYGHALDPDVAGLAFRDIEQTADSLGRDGDAWRRIFGPLVEDVDKIVEFATGQLVRLPPHLIAAAKFGLRALEQGSPLWNRSFKDEIAPALLTGVNAHSVGRLPSISTAGAGLLLATLAHCGGWPVPVGGSQAIVDAMADDLKSHGGEIITGFEVTSLSALPPSRVTMMDTSARAMARITGDLLPSRFAARINKFKYGNAAAKIDFALNAEVPWRNPDLSRTPTIHIGGNRQVLAHSEAELAAGKYPTDPYVLLAQPSMFDGSRAPAGKHVLWTYTHVPAGSDRDMTETVVKRIERFAPGFRDVIEETQATSAVQLEAYNPNYIGGDFSAGAVTVKQLFKRPVLSAHPWSTPVRGLYLCSSSTPPGPGVHGMSGWHAAVAALRECFGLTPPDLGATSVSEPITARD